MGVRVNEIALRDNLVLSLDDVTPLAIVPMKVSNGASVKKEFEKLAERTGIPRAILTDHGSDIKLGTDEFCRQHSDAVPVYDIVHKLANALKSSFDRAFNGVTP